MKKIIFLSMLIIITTLFIPAVLAIGINLIPGGVQPSLTSTERIYDTSMVAESFKATRDNLTGIGVSIKNPNNINKNDLMLSIYNNKGQFVISSIINGKNIEDGDFIKFKFYPIADSKGKNYIFVLSSISTEEKTPFEVFYSDKIQSNQENLSNIVFCKDINGAINLLSRDKIKCNNVLTVVNNHKNGLSFVSFYKPSNFLFLSSEIYKQWFYNFISDMPFAVFYIAIILILLSLLFKLRKYSN